MQWFPDAVFLDAVFLDVVFLDVVFIDALEPRLSSENTAFHPGLQQFFIYS